MENRACSSKILITGAGGLIGGCLFEKLKNFDPIGVVYNLKERDNGKNFIEADLRDEKKVKEIFEKYKPSTVFHFAAFSSPQKNEANPKFALDSNLGITRNIVNNLSSNTHVIFPSTDKVFDGSDPNPDEETEVKPSWLYADLKYQCEEIIRKNTEKFHIVRLPIVHSLGKLTIISNGVSRGSFIDKAINDLKAGRQVSVFKNVKRCFLRVEELLNLFEMFIDDSHYGTYHIGTKMINYYDRLCALCDELGIAWKDKIIPVEGNAKPLAQNLNTEKVKKTFGVPLT
jgi:dTDP-4-dehydrorhamnose reductase